MKPEPLTTILSKHARRADRIAKSAKRVNVRERAIGRAEAYRTAARLVRAYRVYD